MIKAANTELKQAKEAPIKVTAKAVSKVAAKANKPINAINTSHSSGTSVVPTVTRKRNATRESSNVHNINSRGSVDERMDMISDVYDEWKDLFDRGLTTETFREYMRSASNASNNSSSNINSSNSSRTAVVPTVRESTNVHNAYSSSNVNSSSSSSNANNRRTSSRLRHTSRQEEEEEDEVPPQLLPK